MTEIEVYVRYCETDAGGHVNNTSYFIYFEEARTKFFEAVGFSPRNRAIDFIVARTECDFLAQAYAGQTLKLVTSVSKIGTKSYTMAHELSDAETGMPIARGSAVVVCFDYTEQQTKEIPNQLRRQLEQHLKPVKEHST